MTFDNFADFVELQPQFSQIFSGVICLDNGYLPVGVWLFHPKRIRAKRLIDIRWITLKR
jgi:hypothetical protein